MTIEEAIYAWWTGNSTLCALTGSRLYPALLPQGTAYPAVAYRLVSERQPLAHDGPLDLVTDTFQFDCYARTSKAATALGRALRQQLHGFRGTMGTVSVHGVFFVNAVEDFGDQLDVFRVSVDIRFNYKET